MSSSRAPNASPRVAACNLSCQGARLKLTGDYAELACGSTIPASLRRRSDVYYWRMTGQTQVERPAQCVKAGGWHILTFGSHGQHYKRAATICDVTTSAAYRRHAFPVDSCEAASLETIPSAIRDALNLTTAIQGVGWWKWKPYVIRERFARLRDGDVLLYLDRDFPVMSGRSLAPAFCLGQNAHLGVVGFHMSCFTDRAWTKRQVVRALGATEAQLDTNTAYAGIMALRKGGALAQQVLDDFTGWARTSSFDGAPLASRTSYGDTCATLREQWNQSTGDIDLQDPRFCDHRHDQSTWSIMLKQRGIKTFPVPPPLSGGKSFVPYEVTNIWGWEAGYCSEVMPFLSWPVGANYGQHGHRTRRTPTTVAVDNEVAKCVQLQGSASIVDLLPL